MSTPDVAIPAEGPVLGIDPGGKRVGVAVLNILGMVLPIGYLDADPRDALVKKIAALALDRQCVGIVVGLPLNMDGTESPGSKLSRALARELGAAAKLPVEVYDERLTSHSAEGKLAGLGLTRRMKKANVDALAAAAILETWFSEKRATKKPPPSELEEESE